MAADKPKKREEEDEEGRNLGLPPACVLTAGLLVGAVLMFGAMAVTRHTGLLSQDPLLAPCSAELLAKAPLIVKSLERFPEEAMALGKTLAQTNSSAGGAAVIQHAVSAEQRAHAIRVADRVVAMLRITHDARKLARCGGGAKALGGVEPNKLEHMHRLLWRVYGKARKMAPTSGGPMRGGAKGPAGAGTGAPPRRSKRAGVAVGARAAAAGDEPKASPS